jgi:hypothetical protein
VAHVPTNDGKRWRFGASRRFLLPNWARRRVGGIAWICSGRGETPVPGVLRGVDAFGTWNASSSARVEDNRKAQQKTRS